MLLQDERNQGSGIDALVSAVIKPSTGVWFGHGCSGKRSHSKMNGIGHGCSGHRMLLEHERN